MVIALLLTLTFTVATSGIHGMPTSSQTHPVETTSTTTIQIDPPIVTTEMGQSFQVDVRIQDVVDLYGWEFKLGWDATLLDALDITEGDFLKSQADTFFVININNTQGYLRAVCTLIGNIPGVTGSGILATIEFHVEATGECVLDLYDTKLVSSAEQPIEHTVIDGYFGTLGHDVAVVDLRVSPITVLPGDIVKINVTVQNQGDFPETFNVTAHANLEIIGVQPVALNNSSSTTLAFTWDTTGFEKGDYTISASASIVPGEIDTADNCKVGDDDVTVLYLGHDVAVIDVSPLKTVIGENRSTHIAVAVKNYGVFSETFDTVLFANTTAIATQTVTLASGEGRELTFTWSTAGFAKGKYTITAYAEPVSGETNTVDNMFAYDWITVTIPGDVDGDKDVDIFDMVEIASVYGVKLPDSRYQPNCDIDGDGDIDIFDLVIAAANYGKRW